MVNKIRTHMIFFTCEFFVRKRKKTTGRPSGTNIINVTAWDRRRCEEIEWFKGDATFGYGFRASLRPYLILRLLDSLG